MSNTFRKPYMSAVPTCKMISELNSFRNRGLENYIDNQRANLLSPNYPNLGNFYLWIKMQKDYVLA